MNAHTAFRERAARARAPVPRGRTAARDLGGTDGNHVLTSITAAVLVVLLAAEGLTILRLDSLRSEHMFIGLVLIGPVLLKLGSTGYRFARYYTGSGPYRKKGPPAPALRLLAPVLVAATVSVFATGVALLLLGHRSGLVLLAHQASFVVWGACFAVHFLYHLPGALRALNAGGRAQAPRRVSGSGARSALLAASVGGGLAVALSLLSLIEGWQSGQPF